MGDISNETVVNSTDSTNAVQTANAVNEANISDAANAADTANAANTSNSTNTSQTSESDVLLQEIRNANKKTLFWQRISACSVFGVFLVFVIVVLILVPKVSNTLSNVDSVAKKAEATLEEADTMMADISGATDSLNGLVNDNAETLTKAVNDLAGIDFDGLNTAIQDLQDAVGPMASFFNRFR